MRPAEGREGTPGVTLLLHGTRPTVALGACYFVDIYPGRRRRGVRAGDYWSGKVALLMIYDYELGSGNRDAVGADVAAFFPSLTIA